MTLMNGPALPGINMDPDSKAANGWVKAEPGSQSSFLPSNSPNDDDIYEDAGDLDFTAATRGLYLARLPKMVWENWAQLDHEQEIQLGTVRVEGSLDKIDRMSLMLAPELASRASLPREYLLDITNSETVNAFVFSERDLPGYTSKLRDSTTINGGAATPQSQRPKPGPQGIEKSRKGPGRRGVPKQTAIAGRIQKELQCLPVDNENFRRIMEKRAKTETEKKTTSFEDGAQSTAMAPVQRGAGDSFASFIKTGKPAKKSQKLKAARMPQNELLEEIFRCFKKYEYWSLKNLIREIRQPEIYLKQTLEKVAHLIKSGRFSGQWQLTPSSKAEQAIEHVKSEQAPELASPKISDMEFDDEELEEMEDVVP